jgi:two-component system chemotaxis response regulator CheY
MEQKQPIVALVDDDPIFQLTASRTIRNAQLSSNILQFEDGEVAIKFLKENAVDQQSLPDIIFLDINMPIVDGWMFLEDFKFLKRDLTKKIVIYMVSSSIDPRDITKAKKYLEITDYIVKPITRDKFVEVFGSLINSLN